MINNRVPTFMGEGPTALAGRSFGDRDHITHATEVATAQLNTRARPGIWGRPAPPTRRLRRRYVYVL
ncbi:hypothetical protein [Streptomyces canus]|uniref:hypothetical protein n=1 Tax=Streptomyces canus TaxID=58343 RepID=UPI003CF984D1